MKTTTKNVIKKGTDEGVKNKFVDFLHSGVERVEVRGVEVVSKCQVLTQVRNRLTFEKFLKNKANDKMNGKMFKKIISRLRFFAATR